MQALQTKTAAFEIKKEPDEDGIFEGYASVFDVVDQGMDVVAKGAFTKSLGSGRKVKMLWQHDSGKVIGVWNEMREDERGLYVKGRLLKDVTLGREAMALMRAGAIDSMSIGYRTIEAVPEAGGRVRKLTELDLFEVSVVTFPMNEAARVTDVKSLDWRNPRDVEKSLRDVWGISQAEAKAFIADGLRGLQAKRDVGAGEADSEAAKGFMEQIRLMQRNVQCLNKST